MRIRKKDTQGNKPEKKSIVRGRTSTRRSARANKAAGRGRGKTRTRSKSSRLSSSSPPTSSPPPARVDIPLSMLKVPQEGQASPTIKRKFEVVSSEDAKKPTKSTKTNSPTLSMLMQQQDGQAKSDHSKTQPKKLDMPQKSAPTKNVDAVAIINKNVSVNTDDDKKEIESKETLQKKEENKASDTTVSSPKTTNQKDNHKDEEPKQQKDKELKESLEKKKETGASDTSVSSPKASTENNKDPKLSEIQSQATSTSVKSIEASSDKLRTLLPKITIEKVTSTDPKPSEIQSQATSTSAFKHIQNTTK